MYPYSPNAQYGWASSPMSQNYATAAINQAMANGSLPQQQGQALLRNLANPNSSPPTSVNPVPRATPQPVMPAQTTATPTTATLPNSWTVPSTALAPVVSTDVRSTTPSPFNVQNLPPTTATPTTTAPPVGPGSAALPTNMGYITQAPAGVPNSGVPFSPLNTTGDLYASTLNQQWATPFVPPTAADVEATPGYQFMLQQGEDAIQRSAAAQGNLLTGGVAKDLNNYAQNFADQYYQQAYNNLLNQYQMNYNIFNQNQSNLFNRLSAITGTGQTSTSQLANAGANYANQAANTGMVGASNVANALNNAGAAMASGYVGAANAWRNTAQSLGQLPLAYATLAQNQGLINALGGL